MFTKNIKYNLPYTQFISGILPSSRSFIYFEVHCSDASDFSFHVVISYLPCSCYGHACLRVIVT